MELFFNFIHHFSNGIYNFLSFSLIVSIIIFAHEYGHYIVAKICNVKVESFSIGCGPEIFGFYDNCGTRWKLSIIPLGGYIKMLGDNNISSVLCSNKEFTEEEKLYSIHTKPRYKKAAIVFAGPFANILLSFIFFTLFFIIVGCYNTPPIIKSVIKGSPAEQSGLLSGDTIIEINKYKIKYFEDISKILRTTNLEEEVEVKYIRDNKEHKVILIPSIIKDSSSNLTIGKFIGITSNVSELSRKSSFLGSIVASINETYYTMYLTIKSLFQIITGNRSINEIGGPIKIAKYSRESTKNGISTVLYFIATLSSTLAVVNLLPIIPLDGGHLFSYIIEIFIRRDLGFKYYKYVSTFGITMLFLIMSIAILNDIKYLFY